MTKLWLTTAAALFASAPALAADLPPAVYKAPSYQATAAHDWNGWYAGVNGGYGWGLWDSSSAADLFGTGAGSSFGAKGKGWLGGLQIGHNWQNGAWLYGIEADAQITGQKAGNDSSALLSTVPFGGGNLITSQSISNEWKLPWFATLRGRAGVTANNWLLFGTGGLALGHFKFASTTATTVDFTGAPPSSVTTVADLSDSTTRLGFALGAGIEIALSQHWTAKAEYLYLDFGTRTFLDGTASASSIRLNDHILRGGINYAF